MSDRGLNSADTSRPSAKHAVALGLVLLSVTVVGAALGGVTAAESQSSPVEISDWTDLDDIRNDTDADYVLVNDLNETTPGYDTVAGPNANGGNGFAPIGGFSGSFDGQGNTIDELTIDRPNENEVGLFGDTSGSAVIEEVILTSATVNGSRNVGGLVGLNSGTVSNASASGAVTGFDPSVGGLVGFNTGDGTVSDSSASGAVTGFGLVGGLVGFNNGGTVSSSSASGVVNGSSNVGGLVGRIVDNGTVSNSSASGAVNATTGSRNVGGLVGYNFEGTVSESFATGAVSGSSDVGGLVGQLGYGGLVRVEEAILRDSYYDNQTTGQQAAVGTIVEGDGTAELRGEVTGLPTSQMQGASAAQNMGGLDFTSTWRVVTNPPGYPELRGLSDGPDTEPPLTAVFTVTPENPTVGEQLTLNAGPSTPKSEVESYNWTLGDGTTATGRQVTHTYTNSGQFTVGLTVQNGTETDTASTGVRVDAPAAFDVTLTSVDSEVTAGDSISVTYEVTNTGDLQDTQALDFAVNGTTEDTEASVTLNGSETFSGQFSYTTGAADIPTVSVAVASEDDSASETVTVKSQSGPVEISDWTDLQAIGDSQANLSDDYVLVNDLNKSTAGYNAVVLNQTATEFTEDVSFDEGESRVNLTRTPVAELLSNDEGLNLTVVDSANGTIERENTSSFSFPDVTYTTSTEQFVGFNPIGPSFFESFTGSFDGQGNTIRDLLIDRPTGDPIGLFGVSEGTIEQITVANVTITGFSNVGGLVGRNYGTVSNSSASGDVTGSEEVGGLVGDNDGTVSSSSASGDVTATGEFSHAGGLVGDNRGMVINSSASGAVTGSKDVGGLVGNSGGTVSSSSASGAVNGSDDVGGLVGFNFGTVSNSAASGAVNATGSGILGSAGGLVGRNSQTVSNSSASGTVTGSDDVGGLVGINSGGTVNNSSASGTVTGSEFNVGGLVGYNFEGTVSESFATGAVTGSSNVGGLVGRLGNIIFPGKEAILRDSYYDTQTTEQQVAVGMIQEGDGAAELRGEVAGLNTSQMQGASAAQNMGALDFTNTWRVVTNPPGYPELRSLLDGPDTEPPLTAVFTVTPENPTVGEQLTLNAGPSTPKSEIESYNWTLGDGTTATGKQVTHSYTNSGQFTVDLTVQNGTETATTSTGVRVDAPATFEVTVTSVDSEVTAGDSIGVTYEVTNTGDLQDTQALDFAVNGTTEDTEAGVMLNGSETFSDQFSYDTVAGDTPAVSVAVSSADDSTTETVIVNTPAMFDVTLTSVNSAVTAGEMITASYEVTNTGDRQATQDIEFTVNGTVKDTEAGVTLNGTETFSGQFSYSTSDADTPAVSVTVSSEDTTASADVIVRGASGLVVTNLTTPAAVTVGDSLNFTATVSNPGTSSITQQFNLTVNGTTVDTTTVSLDGGNATTVQLTWQTGAGDDGNATVRLSGGDAAATTNVSVAPLTVADYADENGIVTTFGLFDAIEDWREDLIGGRLLLDVIDAWRSDKPV